MIRNILAVILGYAVWTVIWLGGGAGLAAVLPAAFVPGEPIGSTAGLACLLALSVVCSLAAGMSTQKSVATASKGPAAILALLLLATGIGVQVANRESMPLWFHISFLALLVPIVFVGSRLVGSRLVGSRLVVRK